MAQCMSKTFQSIIPIVKNISFYAGRKFLLNQPSEVNLLALALSFLILLEISYGDQLMRITVA